MSRDWDGTWERWRDMTPEEREQVRAEIAEGLRQASRAFAEACESTAAAMRELAASMAPMVATMVARTDQTG